MKNKVAVLVEPERLELEERQISVGDNELLIKVAACGLCSWELHHFRGEIGPYPQVLGHEVVGMIEEIGKNVKGFNVGDKVTGLEIAKGFAEYAVADPKFMVKVPDSIELTHALGEPLKCIVTIARTAGSEFGDYAMVVGCGFMGLVTLASIAGSPVAELIAVDTLDSKLKLAKQLGATITLNPENVNMQEEIDRVTGGRGVDISIECTGIPAGLDVASRYVRPGRAKILLVSSHSPSATYDLSLWERGAVIYNPHPEYSLDEMDDLRRAMDALEKGKFPMDKLITHRFSLDDIQKAFEMHSNKPEGYVKGIVIP